MKTRIYDPSCPYRRSSKMVDYIRRRCDRLGYEFDLDRDWVFDKLFEGVCEATGIPFHVEALGKDTRNRFAPSIDRVDSTKGYTKDNCRMVIYQYNACKGPWKDSDVIEFAKRVLENVE